MSTQTKCYTVNDFGDGVIKGFANGGRLAPLFRLESAAQLSASALYGHEEAGRYAFANEGLYRLNGATPEIYLQAFTVPPAFYGYANQPLFCGEGKVAVNTALQTNSLGECTTAVVCFGRLYTANNRTIRYSQPYKYGYYDGQIILNFSLGGIQLLAEFGGELYAACKRGFAKISAPGDYANEQIKTVKAIVSPVPSTFQATPGGILFTDDCGVCMFDGSSINRLVEFKYGSLKNAVSGYYGGVYSVCFDCDDERVLFIYDAISGKNCYLDGAGVTALGGGMAAKDGEIYLIAVTNAQSGKGSFTQDIDVCGKLCRLTGFRIEGKGCCQVKIQSELGEWSSSVLCGRRYEPMLSGRIFNVTLYGDNFVVDEMRLYYRENGGAL